MWIWAKRGKGNLLVLILFVVFVYVRARARVSFMLFVRVCFICAELANPLECVSVFDCATNANLTPANRPQLTCTKGFKIEDQEDNGSQIIPSR